MTHCFCILGWHFPEEFYHKIYQAAGDKYIICHRERDYFANRQDLFEKLKDDLHFGENQGLEWGGYHQFNEMGLHHKYDFVIYCHDDLEIKDWGFVEAIQRRLRNPQIKVVGNGRNGSDWEFRFAKYKNRMSFADDDDFIVRTVRGSFFAARSEIFATLGNFPVYSRAKKMTHGNISLRNFAYLVTKHFGRESITYLEDQHLETKYIIEYRRGEHAEKND